MPGNEIIEIVTCQQTEFEMIGFELPISLFSSVSLCVIFTILVSFSRDNALFASMAKINVF